MDFLDCPSDAAFGPGVQGCRGDFDFTLKFQKIILSILPSAIMIATSATRIAFLSRRERLVDGSWFQYAKLMPYIFAATFQLSLLGLSTKSSRLADFFVASAALECAASLCMAAVSFYEHSRTPRPSILLGCYLALTMLFDIAQTRSLWLASRNSNNTAYVSIFTVTMILRLAMLALESLRKDSWLRWDRGKHSPEETIGIFELSAFSWVYKLLLMGQKKILDMPDLYTLDYNMSTKVLHKHLDDIKPSKLKGKRNALAVSLVKALAFPMLQPAAPRLAWLVFNISKPLLIESLLDYLSNPDSRSANAGYGLIGATIIIYVGDPITMSLFGYYNQRAMFIVRSVLVDAVYRKTLTAKAAAADDAKSLTLMSADVERIRQGMLSVHIIWSVPIQVGVTCFLLYRQLGAAFVAPIVLISICTGLSAFIMRFVRSRQTAWMQDVEKRVGKTANAISNMKSIKISGLASAVEGAIQKMRVDELKLADKFRIVELVLVAFSFTPQTLAPVFTFALTARTIDFSSVFTSAALLSQMAGPLTDIFQVAPTIVAGLACLQRVQSFLEMEDRKDFRQFPEHSDEKATGSDHSGVIEIRGGSFGWEEGKMTLKDIDMLMAEGLNIVVGPIASGKSTLCKAILGETPYAEGDTVVKIDSTKIGFCDQVAFLKNGTIRENIIGFGSFDAARYALVVEAAMLNQDLAVLPHGDQTKIGSAGIALSGGQKQRVSIARSLYQDCELYIFDDILSGLDTDTEHHVFTHVFGPDGLLKKQNANVVLCTHAVHHLPSADHIVALSPDGTIAEQGTFASVMANKQYVHSLGLKEGSGERQLEAGASSAEVEERPLTVPKSVKPEEELAKEDLARRTGDMKVFGHYFRSVGAPWMAAFVFAGLMSGFFWNFPNIWLKFWAQDATSESPNHSNSFYIGIYSLFQCVALTTIAIVVGMSYLIIANLSGIKLHQYALRTITSAPLRFFSSTDVGVITNLFSQDMNLLDSELPEALLNVVVMVWILAGAAAIAATASPYVVISYPVVFTVAFYLQRFYLHTSRQLRLLDLEAKSPLYTNFIDTMKGIVTFRALAWGEEAVENNNRFLDASTSPAYLLAVIQQWLILTLGFLTAIVAILIVALSTQLDADSGFTGASMVAIISFGAYLAALIQNYVNLETSIGAVNRLMAFSDNTEVEDLPGEDVVPQLSWPERGNIEIRGASASYDYSPRPDTDNPSSEEGKEKRSHNLALKELAVTIEAGQKVALCGRTGSGKSSFVLLLLRLLDPMLSSDLVLSIDGMHLRDIDRSTLRQRLIAVPQDPVFLPDGTSYMTNLDPSHVSTENECQASLESVNLWSIVRERGGLQSGMSADSFSQGQKQLFSLARAILRRRVRARQLSKEVGPLYLEGSQCEQSNAAAVPTQSGGRGILILDEYSSSLDHATDRLMQDIIRKEFKGYTIVMVSHRLEMVMTFDKVVVLDAGSVVEDGVPKELVEQEGSRFRDLWLAKPE